MGEGIGPLTAPNQAQLERFEARFAPMLARARQLPALASDAVATVFPDGLPDLQFPEATANRQMLAATPLYHAAVAALGEPGTSLGALALIRALVETWSHLYFIMGDDQLTDSPCRALRLEDGWAAESLGLLLETNDAHDDELEAVKQRQALIEQLKNQRGCKGGRRDYRNVAGTLKDLATRESVDWAVSEWRHSSQIAHAAGWELTVTVDKDGRGVSTDPAPSWRATSLNHIVIVFHSAAMTYVAITRADPHSEPARAFIAEVRGVLDDPWLKRMVARDFD
jgi:hypothetical protein